MSRPKRKTIANRQKLSSVKNKKIKIQVEMLDSNFSHAFYTNVLKDINNNVLSSNELNSIPKLIDKETQTIDPYSCYKSSVEDFDFEKIRDLCCIFIDSLSSWSSMNHRY